MARSYQRWTPEERALVEQNYASGLPEADLLAALPNRTRGQVRDFANRNGMARGRPAKRSREEMLTAKREGMRRQRADNPDGIKARQKRWREDNHAREIARERAYRGRRFFWARAMRLKGNDRAGFRDLARMWKRQRGCCALTGARLDRGAELDHILPKARGGTDEATNLRWTCARANRMKRDMTDEELLEMCRAVVAFAGMRLAMVDAIDGTP